MSHYIIEDRATGEVVHAYSADAPDHTDAYPFGAFNHILQKPAPAVAPQRRITKQEFIDRFTQGEMDGILATAKTVVAVEAWLFRFNSVTPDADGTSIDLNDQRTIAGVHGLEAGGLIAAGRAAEILA